MSQPPDSRTPPTRPIRLLLVQHDRAEAELLLDRFADDGWIGAFEVTHFVDPAEAHDASAAIPFDLIVVDIDFPDDSGTETLRDLHARRPKAPIVAMTRRRDARNEATAAGAADVVLKGADAVDALERSLRALLESSRA